MALDLLVENPEYIVEDASVEKYQSNFVIHERYSVSSLSELLSILAFNERTLLYSVNVLYPPNISRVVSEEDLPASLSKSAKEQFSSGYFYNEEICNCSSAEFRKALQLVLSFAEEVEIAARLDIAKPLVRKIVKIQNQ